MINLTFQQIEIFLEVAKRLNITAVAEELYVNQSAISRSIMRLEESLGVVLFERNRRGLKLTEDGKFLYDKLQVHFNSICNAIIEMQNIKSNKAALLKIGYPTTIDINQDYAKLNRFIREYKRSNREVKFTESIYNFEELKTKLRYGDIDVIFLPNFAIYDYNEMNVESMGVLRFRLFIAVGAQNPARRGDALDLNILRKQPVFTISGDKFTNSISEFLHGIEYENTDKIIVPNQDTLIRAVKDSDWGFAVIGNQKFDDDRGVGIKLFSATETEYSATLHMAWRTDNKNIELRKFIKSISENKQKFTNF